MKRRAPDIFRDRARSFWFAARFLPSERRQAVAGLYRFARMVDDLADEPSASLDAAEVAELLGGWRCWLERPVVAEAPDPTLGLTLRSALIEHGVPAAYLQLLVDGVASDLIPRDMRSWSELRAYCVQVASSVGLAMCHLLGAGHDPLARAAAIELGIGMQLTNILRDVAPDLRAGRVYLAADDLAAHGYSRERLVWLAARVVDHGPGEIDSAFRDLMRGQIVRAREHYQRGLEGVWRLPADCQLAILLAGRLYRAILDSIEAADYDVFSRRASTSVWLKLGEAIRWSITLGVGARVRRPALGVRPLDCRPGAARRRHSDGLTSELLALDELVLVRQ